MYSPPNSMFLIQESCIERSPNEAGAAAAPVAGAEPDDPPPQAANARPATPRPPRRRKSRLLGREVDDGESSSAMNQSS